MECVLGHCDLPEHPTTRVIRKRQQHSLGEEKREK